MDNKEKKNLLIVDDEINVLQTLRFIFEDSGFNVTMVSSGPEALEKVKENKYDLALLDINMPEMDGLTTFREIKKISPGTAVIMMTGNKESVQIRKSLEEGAYTIVYKPFAINKLLEIMGNVLKVPVVLVVDDRRDDRVILRNLLELEQYRVIEASDGMDAINKIKKGNFDICLVDYKMPGMDGLETIDEIKKINTKIGVILMSGFSLEEAIRKEIEEHKGMAFIKKPYEINNLVDIIKEEMEKNRKNEDDEKAE
ncbi:MAG: response regulator [Elusimicrobia bacterium]|nr:response regulator [Elusimicrobiota bacterium]